MKCPECEKEMATRKVLHYINGHPLNVIEVADCKCGYSQRVS